MYMYKTELKWVSCSLNVIRNLCRTCAMFNRAFVYKSTLKIRIYFRNYFLLYNS